MQVQVLYFAVFRERLNASQQLLDVADNATVADLIAILSNQHEVVASMSGHFRVAVNEEFVALERPLQANDVVALIPPVSGG
jgi:molybdopterin converting factor subunit 1